MQASGGEMCISKVRRDDISKQFENPKCALFLPFYGTDFETGKTSKLIRGHWYLNYFYTRM